MKLARERGITLDLNEGNVDVIFNRCRPMADTKEEDIEKSILFSRHLGYDPKDELVIEFDKNKLEENAKSIKYDTTERQVS